MKIIVFTINDGRTALTPASPIVVDRLVAGDMTEQEAVDAIKDNAVKSAIERGDGPITNIKIVNDADVPEVDYVAGTHGDFRDALENIGAGPPTVNMDKARSIQEERVAIAKLQKAQTLLVRETAGENITAEKAALRAIDVRSEIAAAQTPDELRAVWPQGLERS